MRIRVERIEICCPSYLRTVQPVAVSRVRRAGWVLFFVFGVFPLGLLGLLLRESYRLCRACRARLG